MATTKTIQPTGETITIPAMADQPDMSVVATDLGNITDAVNAQNQALSKVDTAHNFGQYTSLDTFKNDLLTFMRNVASFKTVAIQFVFTQTVAPFMAWSTFSGYAHCIQNGSTSLYFSCDVASNNGEDISIGYSNGTWNINKLVTGIDAALTITRVENAYCGEEQINRLFAVRRGNVLFLNGNLACLQNTTPMNDYVTIATISGWSAISDVHLTVSSQNDATKHIVVHIVNNGTIRIYSSAGTIGSFYRFNVCVPTNA